MFRSFLFAGLVMAASAFTTNLAPRVEVGLHAEVDRRTAIANAAMAATGVFLGSSQVARALDNIPADNEIVKESRQVTSKLDINNAPVADYMLFPGMYPTIGGKIANNGPYKAVKDIYKIEGLSSTEKSTIKKYESAFTATEATGLDTMRGRDPYRRSFNQFAQVSAENTL